MSGDAVAGRRICAVHDIPDNGSAAFSIDLGDRLLGLMVLRRGEAVFVYVNDCPHWGAPLDFEPGRFLDPTGTLIQCSTHGALFRIDDGTCIKGPCLGARLQAVPCRVEAGVVVIDDRVDLLQLPAPRLDLGV